MGWKRLLISQPPVISLEIFSRIGASLSWSVPRAGASIPSLSHPHKKVPPYTQSAQPVGILLWKKCSTAEINFFFGNVFASFGRKHFRCEAKFHCCVQPTEKRSKAGITPLPALSISQIPLAGRAGGIHSDRTQSFIQSLIISIFIDQNNLSSFLLPARF